MPLGAHTFSGLECTCVHIHAKSDFLNGFKWLERSINHLQRGNQQLEAILCIRNVCLLVSQRLQYSSEVI